MENFLANEGYLEVSSDEIRKFIITGGSARTFVQFTGFTWSFLAFALSTYGSVVVQPFTSSLRSILGWGDCKVLNSFPFAALEKVRLTVETMEPWAVRPTWGSLKHLSTDIVAVEIIGFINKCILDIMAPVRATVTSLHIRCNHPEMFPEGSIKIVDIFPSITTLTLHIFLEDGKWSDLFAALQLKSPQLKTLSVQPYPTNTDEMFQVSLGKNSPLVKMQRLTNFQLFPYLPTRSNGDGVKITDKTFNKIFSYLKVEQFSFRGLHEALGNITADGIMALTRLPKNEYVGIASTLKVFEYKMSGAATGERVLFNDKGEEFTMVEHISASELEVEEAWEAVKLMAMNNRRKSPPSNYSSVFTNQF